MVNIGGCFNYDAGIGCFWEWAMNEKNKVDIFLFTALAKPAICVTQFACNCLVLQQMW
jgi:hypothetical protein